MLEIRHLKSLKAIAETNKLSLAAERVFLTQSALSHQIRALETHTISRYLCVLRKVYALRLRGSACLI